MELTEQTLWETVCQAAEQSGLNPTHFATPHRQIVAHIAEFLTQSPPPQRRRFWQKRQLQQTDPTPPLIIVGEPGTGKTTFLYLIDHLLRTQFSLPDNIDPIMTKTKTENGRTITIPKRMFCGHTLTLLSVKKWAQLLHFYTWDTINHRFDPDTLNRFVAEKLRPMRVLFADEVEIAGYAPTLPDLAQHGILVVGTSNQYHFPQLVADMQPTIIQFDGDDMRLGDPADAAVQPIDPLNDWFIRLATQPEQSLQTVHYQRLNDDGTIVFLMDFIHAVNAPLLENEWSDFLQATYQQAAQHRPYTPDSPFILLFDRFSLDALAADPNKIIRFISLFDAIDQLGVGVLVRNTESPLILTHTTMTAMKQAIEANPDLTPETKHKALVGIDRMSSRLGQAAHRARITLAIRH